MLTEDSKGSIRNDMDLVSETLQRMDKAMGAAILKR